jgi:hypothetical protein
LELNRDFKLGRTITWNKPASITQGTRTLSFLDDPDHQRFQQVTPQGTTLYFDSFNFPARCRDFAVTRSEFPYRRLVEWLQVGLIKIPCQQEFCC